MKKLLALAAVLLSLNGLSQNKATPNYPVLANAHIVSEGAEANAAKLVKNETVRFNVIVLNLNQAEPVKAGSCYLQIELGKSLRLAGTEGRNALPLRNYIAWTVSGDEAGAIQLTGRLIADLPGDFAETLSFELACAETGSSLVKVQWMMPAERIKTGLITSLDYTVKKKKAKD